MAAKNNTKMTMTPEAFRDWRKRMGLKQKDAADLLGLKKRVIQYYEKGSRDGKKVEIPKTVRLACHALSAGVEDYDGTQAVLMVPVSEESEPETETEAEADTAGNMPA